MLKIQEEDVKKALTNGFEALGEIHNRIIDLHKELTDTESIIRSVALKQIRYGDMGGSGNLKKDLTEAMLKHERLTRQREIEIREAIWRLTEEEEKINRIRVCYQSLRGKEYTYLHDLYVCGKPYKAVERESGVSHRTFELTRKSGLKKILQLYESDFSNRDIIAKSDNGWRLLDKKKKRRDTYYEQLRLDIDL